MSEKNLMKSNALPEKGNYAINFAARDESVFLCIPTGSPESLPERVASIRATAQEHGFQIRLTIAKPTDCKVSEHKHEFSETNHSQVQEVYNGEHQVFVLTNTWDETSNLIDPFFSDSGELLALNP